MLLSKRNGWREAGVFLMDVLVCSANLKVKVYTWKLIIFTLLDNSISLGAYCKCYESILLSN